MTATRYFTVDSVVQPVQPAAVINAAAVAVAVAPVAPSVALPAPAGRNDATAAGRGDREDPGRRDHTAASTDCGSPRLVESSSSSLSSPPPSPLHDVRSPVQRASSATSATGAQRLDGKRYSVADLMDKLLEDIYRVSNGSVASESSTDQTNWSDGGGVGDERPSKTWSKRLARKSTEELRTTVDLFRDQLNVCCDALVKALKRRDILIARRDAKCNMITALLHAYSMKRNRPVFESSSSATRPGDNRRRTKYSLSEHIWKTGDVMNGLLNTLKNIASLSEDTKMRFNMKPGPGDSDFEQWQSAMKMVARLPDGVPHEFRYTLWLTLAEKYLSSRNVEWPKVERFCFNDTTNPDDEELGVQIVKDLHRTGCSLFCGSSGLENQALLKRVLLGFARWNKAVGYCQGFNMLAALILQVMEKNESDALKVMIYLIEGVLPEGYFANNLRGLSVDMAVFRDLLRVRLQNLSRHLDRLQTESKDSGTSYEPPLTNVFTMQWFLTLFCNCLPQRTVLRVWDLIFLEGSTVLLKTALAIWDALSDRIMTVTSADEFYSIMAVLTREMLEFGLMDANNLINTISTMNELVEVKELRERYRYNINPWVSHMAKRGLRLFYTESDVEETDDDDDDADGGKSTTVATSNGGGKNGSQAKNSKTGLSTRHPIPTLESEREKVALDISSLKKQYSKLKERQKQVQVILTAACSGQNFIGTSNSSAMNHLLFGKTALRCTSVGPIPGSIPLKYIQDVKKPEPKTEPRAREKRTTASSPSSSSSTSTELCDDPASDCCSERSVDDEDGGDGCGGKRDVDYGYGDGGVGDGGRDRGDGDGEVFVGGDKVDGDEDDGACDGCDRNRIDDGTSAEVTVEPVAAATAADRCLAYDDVSLAEILRANSEVLSRMCGGDASAGAAADAVPAVGETVSDWEERLPDLIGDIDAFGESLAAVGRTVDPARRGSCEHVPVESDAVGDGLPQPYNRRPEPEGCGGDDGNDHRDGDGKDDDDDHRHHHHHHDRPVDSESSPVKPFTPFPSKVRQPKRLGIELGLYRDGSN